MDSVEVKTIADPDQPGGGHAAIQYVNKEDPFDGMIDSIYERNHIGHMIATLRESKTRLSELVQLASRGEDVLITVRGKPTARIVPVATTSTLGWMEELSFLRGSVGTCGETSSASALDEVRKDRW